MTQTQVRDALIAHLTAALTDHPGLAVTYSMEDAVARYDGRTGWVLVTLSKHTPERFLGQDDWAFMIQCSKSLQPGAEPTTTAVTDADAALISDLDTAVNDDAGYLALVAAGLKMSELTGMAEDQQSESYINPHTFTCSTF